MTVVVVTDSSACVPPDLKARYDIRVVPLHVLLDGVEFREGVDELPDSVFSSNATTSGAAPAELAAVYEAAIADSDGDGVLAVHISRQLSATWESGRKAALELDGRIRLVDSRGAGLGCGFPVLAAARAAAAGADLDSVYETTVSAAERARSFIVVDRLDQLRRGGRISTAAALLGTALAMKPLLQVTGGKLVLREKARTSGKAIAKLVDAATQAAGAGPVSVAVHHLQAPERAERIASALRERLPNHTELLITEFSAVLGVHVGAGAVGVVVVPEGAGAVEAGLSADSESAGGETAPEAGS